MASQLPTSIGSAEALPLATALSVIPSLPRPLLTRFVARAIERLDLEDGDSDLEDATNAEDEGIAPKYHGPGCPVADPGEEYDHREDEHDAEIVSWSHPDDHPAELFIGRRSRKD